MVDTANIQQIITQVAQELGVDPALALAIAQQESGFNPTAIGDNGHSVGLFQLNDQGEGAGMTVAQREDPTTNARIALTQVAAVAKAHPDWSAGQIAAAAQRPQFPDTYAQSINSIMGNPSAASSTALSAAAASQNASTPVTVPGHSDVPFDPNDPQYATIDPADMNWLRQNAGQYLWMASDPEISKLLSWVAKNRVTDANEITSLFSQTDFYKTHSAATRTWYAMYGNGPLPSADAQKAIHDAQVHVEDVAGQLGVHLTQDQINTLAIDVNQFGLNSEELQRAVGQYSTTTTPSANLASLQQTANQYLMNVSDPTMQGWLTNINSGQATLDQYTAYVQNLAMGKYPWMAQQIQAGMTPQQILAPYQQEIGSTLQIDPNTINFNDPRWAKLTYTTDPKTGMQAQTPLWQSVQQVKTDPTYGYEYTPDAKNSAYDIVANLTKTMGAVAQ